MAKRKFRNMVKSHLLTFLTIFIHISTAFLTSLPSVILTCPAFSTFARVTVAILEGELRFLRIFVSIRTTVSDSVTYRNVIGEYARESGEGRHTADGKGGHTLQSESIRTSKQHVANN